MKKTLIVLLSILLLPALVSCFTAADAPEPETASEAASNESAVPVLPTSTAKGDMKEGEENVDEFGLPLGSYRALPGSPFVSTAPYNHLILFENNSWRLPSILTDKGVGLGGEYTVDGDLLCCGDLVFEILDRRTLRFSAERTLMRNGGARVDIAVKDGTVYAYEESFAYPLDRRIYEWEKGGSGSAFQIILFGDGRYSYYTGMLSSYMGYGTWEESDGILTLRENTGYPFVFRFYMEETALRYIAEGSSGFMYVSVKDGDRFYSVPVYAEEETPSQGFCGLYGASAGVQNEFIAFTADGTYLTFCAKDGRVTKGAYTFDGTTVDCGGFKLKQSEEGKLKLLEVNDDLRSCFEIAARPEFSAELEYIQWPCSDRSGLKQGSRIFIREGGGNGGPFTLTLNEDMTFVCYEGRNSDCYRYGTWEINGGVLTLTRQALTVVASDDTTLPQLTETHVTYLFEIADENATLLRFRSEGSEMWLFDGLKTALGDGDAFALLWDGR